MKAASHSSATGSFSFVHFIKVVPLNVTAMSQTNECHSISLQDRRKVMSTVERQQEDIQTLAENFKQFHTDFKSKQANAIEEQLLRQPAFQGDS